MTIHVTASGSPEVAGPSGEGIEGEVTLPLRGMRPDSEYTVDVTDAAGCEATAEVTTGALEGEPVAIDAVDEDGIHVGGQETRTGVERTIAGAERTMLGWQHAPDAWVERVWPRVGETILGALAKVSYYNQQAQKIPVAAPAGMRVVREQEERDGEGAVTQASHSPLLPPPALALPDAFPRPLAPRPLAIWLLAEFKTSRPDGHARPPSSLSADPALLAARPEGRDKAITEARDSKLAAARDARAGPRERLRNTKPPIGAEACP